MGHARSLSESVYEALRQDILTTRLPPGEKLSELQIAERFGVSRAPVRDAFGRLEQDHLVEVRPQIGTIVSPISRDVVMNILEIRLLLEPHAARQAALNLTDKDRELLKHHFSALAQLPPGSDEKRRQLFETDGLLHTLVWERSGNPEIKRILSRYRGEIQRVRLANAEFGNRLEPSEREIREIFHALSEADAERSAQTLTRHLENIRDAVTSIFESLSMSVGPASRSEPSTIPGTHSEPRAGRTPRAGRPVPDVWRARR